ncbi:MAG TPA: 1,4-alpha-glucan branching protein GlgB [Gemmatimonadaceae bacterium]|nr:1,4-alpha-glucan branching protein GlgB [Gemmatimonadaceae bacterium]
MTTSGSSPAALAGVDASEIARLLAGDHDDPHRVLGAHISRGTGAPGVVLRAMHPDAVRAEALLADGRRVELDRLAGGLFGAFIAGATLPIRYRLRFHFAGGATWERGDPYRFLPTVGEVDLHLFNEGTHRELWNMLGAHPREIDGERGVSFAVWAPNARSAAVIGQHEQWDGRLLPMRRLGSSGVFELFVPDVSPGTMYKYQLRTREGVPRIKTDPFAFGMEAPPETASCVVDFARYEWKDAEWMDVRPERDHTRLPMLIYEMHLGSWARVPEDENRSLTYRELAPRLVEHCQRLGFTHVELMPVMEHPFTGSWGYQVSGYFAPTRRYGSPDDFKYFVDKLHQAGIGVILDWVPAHFPKDDFALRRFDGTALYEHEDPRLGEHPDWGTLIFNYARTEVRNFLIANALFWLREYHCDGLRVDAVASMLYLDYSRKPGEWLRNRYGGRENLEAIEFLRAMNEAVRIDAPGCYTIAEESTSWPGVTKRPQEGGLGFNYKWNMGWMHDTLAYFSQDPLFRSYHQDQLTFAMVYEYSERFIMPLSHDEVVHLKKSLLEKMPGDAWRKLANLRLMLAYMYTRPGKKLLFMGTEIAPYGEWNHDVSLDWHIADDPAHSAFLRFVQELGALYDSRPALWRDDFEPHGFAWIDVADKMNSVLSYVRRAEDVHVVIVLNMTPEPRANYRVGVPAAGDYEVLLSSDSQRFGGSGFGQEGVVHTDAAPFHGFPQSLSLNLPPLGALIVAPK